MPCRPARVLATEAREVLMPVTRVVSLSVRRNWARALLTRGLCGPV